MTQVNMGDEVIETDLPADAVADLQQPAEPAVSEETKTEEAPETPVNPEPTVETPQEPAQPEAVVERPKKATPIASLLEKKHELETALEAERAEKQKLEDQIKNLSNQPVSPQSTDKVKALAEKYGLDEDLLAELVSTAREGIQPELPKEVQDLLAERQSEKQQAEELAAFNKRVDSLSNVLKDDLLKDPKVREKLQALAYSTEKAPDGEPYFQKEISELYFGFVKPEFEPGKPSAEPSRGGSQATEIVDFEEILNDESKMEEFARTAPSEQWQAFAKWRDEQQGDTPIIRRKN